MMILMVDHRASLLAPLAMLLYLNILAILWSCYIVSLWLKLSSTYSYCNTKQVLNLFFCTTHMPYAVHSMVMLLRHVL